MIYHVPSSSLAKRPNKLECLSLAKPLQPRLIFVGKAKSLPQILEVLPSDMHRCYSETLDLRGKA
jgi:hypothetical protein